MRQSCFPSTRLNYIDVSECSGTENTFEECGISQINVGDCRDCMAGSRTNYPKIMCLSGKYFAHNSLSKYRYDLQPTVLMER